MNKIFKKQDEIYIPIQPKENNINDNQTIEKDYNSIRRLVLGHEHSKQNINKYIILRIIYIIQWLK